MSGTRVDGRLVLGGLIRRVVQTSGSKMAKSKGLYRRLGLVWL